MTGNLVLNPFSRPLTREWGGRERKRKRERVRERERERYRERQRAKGKQCWLLLLCDVLLFPGHILLDRGLPAECCHLSPHGPEQHTFCESVCACLCVCVCVCVYCMCTCLHACAYVCVCACSCVCVSANRLEVYEWGYHLTNSHNVHTNSHLFLSGSL